MPNCLKYLFSIFFKARFIYVIYEHITCAFNTFIKEKMCKSSYQNYVLKILKIGLRFWPLTGRLCPQRGQIRSQQAGSCPSCNAAFSISSCRAWIFRVIFVSPFAPVYEPPVFIVVFLKGTWRQGTVWSQSTTCWRSATLGCPVSRTMASTLQRAASGRFLSNGRLLRPWTTVGCSGVWPAVTTNTSVPLCQ